MWQVVAGLAILGAVLSLIGAILISAGKISLLGQNFVVPFLSPRVDEVTQIKGSNLSTGLLLIYLGVISSAVAAFMSWSDSK